MRVLITGGAGFIGQHLARRLHGSHELTALDILHPQVHLDPETSANGFPGQIVRGDVSDAEAWAALPPHDLIVHLAAETGTGQSMYEHERYHRVNIEGTRLAGTTAQRWGAPLISMSSRAVYGLGRTECPVHGTSFDGFCCSQATPGDSHEDDPHRPVSFYGETKSEGESALTDAAQVIPVTIIRPQNVVGPGQALHNPYTGVLAAFLARLREGLPLAVYGDGTATRDLIHVEDLAMLVAWCAENPPPVGSARILNSGTGTRMTLDQLAQAAAAGSPQGTATIEHVDVVRAGDIDHACADLGRLRDLGAPEPTWSSHDAVVDFIVASWEKPGAQATAWDRALDELADRGLTS